MTIRRRVQTALCLLAALSSASGATPVQRSSSSLSVDDILEAVDVRPGATLCEIGAGDGELTIAAARAVGHEGRIYSNELGESRLRLLGEKVKTSGLSQIAVVAGDPTKTNFPDAGCDGIFLRDVYHHLTNPSAINRSIAASLKPAGRVAVIDFTPPGQQALTPAERAQDGQHGVTPETVKLEMKEAGLEPVTRDKSGGRWFLLVFSRTSRRRH